MKIHKTIESLIGNTPVIELRNENPNIKIFAKLEFMNIGGSHKDRIVLSMIKQAEQKGNLTKEKIILESTSGNTGISLSMIVASLGYKVTIVMSKNATIERRKIMKAYGAKLILTNSKEGTGGAVKKAMQLAEKHPDKYFYLDQYSNIENPKAQTQLGKEIFEAVPGITHFIGSIGTFGVVKGAGQTLKRSNPKIRIIGVEPKLGENIGGLRNMQETHKPVHFDKNYIDEMLELNRETAIKYSKILAINSGLFVGESSGATYWGALEVAKRIKKGTIVIIFADRGERYLSTF